MSKLLWLGEVRVLGASQVGLGAAQISDVSARTFIENAFKVVFGRAPTLLEAQFAQAVSRGESYYGQACYKNIPAGTTTCNTWNMGAVQCGLPPCSSSCFEATDHRGPEHGSTAYQACFRKYASPDEGFTHFIQVLYKQRPKVLATANVGDIANFSKTLRESHYFELALSKHIAAMTKNLQAITKARNEPMPSGGGSAGVAQGASAGAAIGLVALAAGAIYVLTKVVSRAA